MQISEIVGSPGRFVLHRGGRFCGEAWLLEFKMWLTVVEPQIEGVTTCTVSFGSATTYAQFVYDQASALADGLVQASPQLHQFVVTTESVPTEDSPMQLLRLVALKLDSQFIEIYSDHASALKAVERRKSTRIAVY